MTEKKKPSPIILNLSGVLDPEWQSYIETRKLTVTDAFSPKVTHILVKGDADFKQLQRKFQTVEKDIVLISAEKVTETSEFARANGKLSLDHSWFENKLGEFILDKFFQEYSGITLKDSYPAFQELGSFNVTNLFSTGDYLDRMVYQAFSNGLPALSVKSYFDHLIMYLAYLRADAKIGLPIEVTYGNFESVFGLQLHFFAEQISLSEIADSLASAKPKSQDDLLRFALNSTEFFDVTYLDNVKKTVVTALWSKTSVIRTQSKGFLLSSMEKSSSLNQFQGEASDPYFASNKDIPDLTGMLLKAAAPAAAAPVTVLKGTEQIKEESTRVTGSKEEPEASTVVSGSKENTADAKTVVSGGTKGGQPAATKVKGLQETPESRAIISGAEEKDNTVHRIPAAPDLKKADESLAFTSFASPSIEPKSDLTVTSLGQEAILHQEILKLQKQIQAKEELVAKILADKEKHIAASVEKAAKENDHLKSKLITLGNELKVLRETQTKIETVQVQTKEALSDEQVDKLTGNDPQALIIRLQREAEQKEIFYRRELEKLQRANVIRESMVEKLKASMAESLRKKDVQIADLFKKLDKDLGKQEVANGHTGNMEFRDFPERKVEHDSAEPVDNRETVKLYQEATQKNIIFQRTVDQLERENASKDMLMDKNRDNFNAAIEKREQEIKELKDRINKILQESAKDVSQGQQLIHLERQNQYLAKMNETYKGKITNLLAEIETLKTPDAKDDAKRLQMQNVQNKNMIESLKRDMQRYQDKSAADLATITNLRGEKNRLEIELKKATLTNKVEKDHNNFEADLKKAQLQIQSLENQLKDSSSKLKDMEAKLADARKSQSVQSNTNDGQAKAKISHLEASVKKLTQDLLDNRNQLGEAKKEVNKVRLEKTAIQNELEKLKKDTDKSSKAAAAASPKKPGTGGKAA